VVRACAFFAALYVRQLGSMGCCCSPEGCVFLQTHVLYTQLGSQAGRQGGVARWRRVCGCCLRRSSEAWLAHAALSWTVVMG
jgi:hypothetical protein